MTGVTDEHRQRFAAILAGAAIAQPVDSELVAAAQRHDVAPLLYRALREARAWEHQSQEVHEQLARIASAAACVDQLRLPMDQTVIAALAADRIPPLVFKGAALAHR